MASSTSSASQQKRPVAILGGNRIPFARSDGAYAQASNQDMFTATLDGLADRFGLAGQRLDMVIGGAVLKHSRDFNLMRECVLGSSLSPYTPAFDLQQACGTGLQAAIAAADGIAMGRYEVAAAGGVDTTSDAPIAFGDDLRRTVLGLRRAKSNVDRLKLVGKLERPLYVETNKVLEALGGKWNRKAGAHIFEGAAADLVDEVLLTGCYSRTKQDFGFFETPDHVIRTMIERAGLDSTEIGRAHV